MKDPSSYSRQFLRENYKDVKEVDFRGHFHPTEIVRKTGRELAQMEYSLKVEDLDIQKTPVGTSTGQFLGVVHGTTEVQVYPAGRYGYLWMEPFVVSIIVTILLLGLYLIHPAYLGVGLISLILLVIFREKLFGREFTYGGEIRTDLVVAIPGEIYEDFRRDEKIPISMNASAMVAWRLKGYWTYEDPKHLNMRIIGSDRDDLSPEWAHVFNSRRQKVRKDMEVLVAKMEAMRDALL